VVRLYRASLLRPRILVSPPCSALSQIADLAASGKCSGPEMFEIRKPYNLEDAGVEAEKPKARTYNSSTAMKDYPVCCILAAPHSAPPEAVANEGWLCWNAEVVRLYRASRLGILLLVSLNFLSYALAPRSQHSTQEHYTVYATHEGHRPCLQLLDILSIHPHCV